jgi:hypothetical protein
MKKSIAVNKKRRGPGRPATGHDPAVALRLPKTVLAAVDRWAKANAVGKRSEALRRLIERGLSTDRTIPLYRATDEDDT